MLDVGSQLVAKWARYGPENKIHVTDDFTRLTLDSIALYDPFRFDGPCVLILLLTSWAEDAH